MTTATSSTSSSSSSSTTPKSTAKATGGGGGKQQQQPAAKSPGRGGEKASAASASPKKGASVGEEKKGERMERKGEESEGESTDSAAERRADELAEERKKKAKDVDAKAEKILARRERKAKEKEEEEKKRKAMETEKGDVVASEEESDEPGQEVSCSSLLGRVRVLLLLFSHCFTCFHVMIPQEEVGRRGVRTSPRTKGRGGGKGSLPTSRVPSGEKGKETAGKRKGKLLSLLCVWASCRRFMVPSAICLVCVLQKGKRKNGGQR